MRNKNMKINCWEFKDGNEVPMPSTTTLDGFEWNGKFRITVTDDDGSLGLPFLFAANDTAIMTVETSEQKGTHTCNKKIKQILRCVPRSLGEEVTCSRIRSHNGKEHVWSEWEQASSSVGATVEWDSASCIDSFVTAGVYNITGERLSAADGLPIENSAPGHTIHARLTVLDSSIRGSGDNDDKCITQILALSNRTGGDGEVYVRTGRASIKNQLAGGTGWEPWGKLQQNIEVGQVTSLNNFIGNGIYSGVYTDGTFFETFVMVVINNYAVAGATGNVRCISQFKYALNVNSNFSYKTRTGRGGSTVEWGSWVDLGAADTADIQDNSITAQKLSTALQEQINKSANGAYWTSGPNAVTLNVNKNDGTVGWQTLPAATTEKAGVMTAEDKMKLEENNLVVSNITVSESKNYSDSMEWELTYNNKESADYYATAVKNADGSVTLTPSQGGTNFPIATYIGSPVEGEIIQVVINDISKATNFYIHTGVTSTSLGSKVIELVENNGAYSAKFKSDGKPIYLRMTVSWSASATSPAVIGSCHINGTIIEFVEDFVTSEDLITEKLAIIPKAEKSYNPGNGALENSATRFGSGLIRVKEGMVLFSDAPQDYYFVLFDYNKNYIRYNRPHTGFLQGGYYRVAEGVEYVAITTYTDFEKIILKVVDESAPVMFPVTYREGEFQPWNQVPAALRKNGVMVTYQLPNGENVIEVFQDPGNINLVSNSFGQPKYWKRLAYTDIVSGVNPHPMKGKTFYSIGDSHRWKWLGKLSEITGATSGGDIFGEALAANEKFYVSRVVSMAKYIVDLYKAGKPVDYIFLEYVHKYFTNNLSPSDAYHYSGDITEAEPFLTQAYYDYTARTFNNTSEASAFWNENFTDIVSLFTPKSTSIIALKTGVKIQTPKFKLLSDTTTAGNFTIKFTDNNGNLYQMAMAITAGLTINEALTLVNEIEFADSGCKWDNMSAHSTITDASLKFTYVGDLNDSDADIKMSFDFGTTGITYDGDWSIATETKDWIRGFKSHDVSAWSDASKWHDLNANMDAYIWIKAAVELLQREIPTAKIFVWTLCTESWNYTDNTIEGKSVLYPDGTLNVQAIYDSIRHKRMVQNVEGWEKVAKYYHLSFIPISEMNSISPANHKFYYTSDNVHPTQEGYDRVAEILADNVY